MDSSAAAYGQNTTNNAPAMTLNPECATMALKKKLVTLLYNQCSTNCPTNDMPTVAGMHAVLEKLIALPPNLASPTQKAAWASLKARVPPLPVINGSYWACDDCTLGGTGPGQHKTTNGENAELYAVHPYRRATVGRGNAAALKLAVTAYTNKLHTADVGWNQNAMDAALLGLASDAAKYVVKRATTAPAQGYRFPAFAPHEQDYEPSADHFAVFSNALQYMLIQRVDDSTDSVLLLPAWPCSWNVNFTVSAPRVTTVTGSLIDGRLRYTVTPPSRASAVRAAHCQVIPPIGPPPPPAPPPGPRPPPSHAPCNVTAWAQLCLPQPSNVSACTRCCSVHSAELMRMNCYTHSNWGHPPYTWADFCEGKPAPPWPAPPAPASATFGT